MPLSKGVRSNGMIPGHEPTMDPSTAGDNWATTQITEDGTEKHYILPTKKGDKLPSHDGTFMGDAAERFRTTQLNGSPKHYGAFDDDKTAQAFMKSQKKTRLQKMYPSNDKGQD